MGLRTWEAVSLHLVLKPTRCIWPMVLAASGWTRVEAVVVVETDRKDARSLSSWTRGSPTSSNNSSSNWGTRRWARTWAAKTATKVESISLWSSRNGQTTRMPLVDRCIKREREESSQLEGKMDRAAKARAKHDQWRSTALTLLLCRMAVVALRPLKINSCRTNTSLLPTMDKKAWWAMCTTMDRRLETANTSTVSMETRISTWCREVAELVSLAPSWIPTSPKRRLAVPAATMIIITTRGTEGLEG